MKWIIVTLIFTGIFSTLSSFQRKSPDNSDRGKAIFQFHCASCHHENRQTGFGGSFQRIRQDYGFKWTVAYLRDARKLRNNGDLNAGFNYYRSGKKDHLMFPVMEEEGFAAVLDYVDRPPVPDKKQYGYRKWSDSRKKMFIRQQQ